MNNAGWFLNRAGAGGGDGAEVRVQDDRGPFKHLPGRAHPRAQDRGMGLGRVVGVVPGMGHRLRIGQAAQKQQADGNANGDGSEGASRQHHGEY